MTKLFQNRNKNGDVIDSVCGGTGRKFHGKPCRYYIQVPDRQCQLLKTRRMDIFWEQCRGAYLIFYNTVHVWNKTFKTRYPGLPIDEAEDFDFEEVIARLQRQDIEMENLAVWCKYVNKTVYLEIKKKLIQRGLVPEKRNCGSCKYLSRSKPYTCVKTGNPRKKTAPPCETYSSNIAYFLSIDAEPSSETTSGRQRPDRLLLEILTAKSARLNTPEALTIAKEEDARTSLAKIIAMLAQRPEHEKPGSKKGKKYERHYAVFTNIMSLLTQGFSKEDAIKYLAKKFTVTEKTVRRDIAEIKDFLREKQALVWLQ